MTTVRHRRPSSAKRSRFPTGHHGGAAIGHGEVASSLATTAGGTESTCPRPRWSAQRSGKPRSRQMLGESFKTSKEAEVYRDALSELGQSIDLELAPQVIKFEKETVELTGDAAKQFAQWRNFLKQIYQAEATPELLL